VSLGAVLFFMLAGLQGIGCYRMLPDFIPLLLLQHTSVVRVCGNAGWVRHNSLTLTPFNDGTALKAMPETTIFQKMLHHLVVPPGAPWNTVWQPTGQPGPTINGVVRDLLAFCSLEDATAIPRLLPKTDARTGVVQ
jgi:hypothetical protein